MSNLKICSQCSAAKQPLIDFYQCSGKFRSECKDCTIKKNVKYQQKIRSWNFRFDNEARKAYMRDYYQKNKQKFIKYREQFREKYPEYYKDYFQKRKTT